MLLLPDSAPNDFCSLETAAAEEHEGESRGAVLTAMIEKGKAMNSLAAGALEALPENGRTGRMEDGSAGGSSSD